MEEGVEIFKSCRDMNLPPAAKQRVEQVLGYYAEQGK